MEQKDLEHAALWLLTKKAGGIVNKKVDSERLRKTLEQARNERSKLLTEDATQEFRLTTVGKVVQDRVQLEKLEKEKVDYIKRARGVDESRISKDQQTRANEENALRRGRVLKLAERVISFRLAGVSCFSVGGRPNDLGLRFDATWGGHYFDEKYYVVLSGASLTVHRHSLPYFIPVEELARGFLPFDPGQFCRRVSRYVCAFAGRRVLAEQLARDFFGKATVETSESLDVITLTGRLRAKGNRPVHSVQLKFESMLDLIPHKANVFFLMTDGSMSVFRLDLDPIPSDLSSSQFFNYTLWITSVLDRSFDKQSKNNDDEDRSETGNAQASVNA